MVGSSYFQVQELAPKLASPEYKAGQGLRKVRKQERGACRPSGAKCHRVPSCRQTQPSPALHGIVSFPGTDKTPPLPLPGAGWDPDKGYYCQSTTKKGALWSG